MKRLLLLSAILLGGCSSAPTVTLHGPSSDIPVQVELARTAAEQELGLMDRTSLPEDHGMLFIFQKPDRLTFWMKNTLIPLDVLFFDDTGNFVSASMMTPCAKDPCATYQSAGAAQYALEVNAGFAAAHHVGSGWTLLLQPGMEPAGALQ